MLKAIGSKVDLSRSELEYNHLVADLLENETVLKMKEFLSDSHPKNLYPLLKTAGEFPPSFLNLKNEVTVT